MGTVTQVTMTAPAARATSRKPPWYKKWFLPSSSCQAHSRKSDPTTPGRAQRYRPYLIRVQPAGTMVKLSPAWEPMAPRNDPTSSAWARVSVP